MQRNRPILITGGAGFIGRWLTREFVQAGARVHILDDLSTGSRANVPVHPGVRLTVGSVLDAHAVDAAFAVDPPRLVVHLAAVVGMRLAHAQREEAYRLAVDGTREVLRRSQVPVVLASSSAVYGLTKGQAVSESLVLEREDVMAYDGGRRGYALGKFDMEQLGRTAAAGGLPVLSLRFFNVVGPGQSAEFGMVLPRFVRAAVAGDDLTVHGDGAQTRSFSDVGVVARLMAMLTQRPELFDGRALNVGCGRSESILTLAQAVVDEVGGASRIQHVPYASVFPGRSDVQGRRPDTARLTEIVGPVQWPDVRAIVADVVAAQLRRSA